MKHEHSESEYIAMLFTAVKGFIRKHHEAMIHEFHKQGDERQVVKTKEWMDEVLAELDLTCLMEIHETIADQVLDSIKTGKWRELQDEYREENDNNDNEWERN